MFKCTGEIHAPKNDLKKIANKKNNDEDPTSILIKLYDTDLMPHFKIERFF
jgi:hypothetical protein